MRRQAEAALAARAAAVPQPGEADRALHELQVHQIELEMQNEELRRTQRDLEASRARYFDLYDQAPVGYITLCEGGEILEANLTAAGLLGVTKLQLVRQPLTRFILAADQDIYHRFRKRLPQMGAPQTCELRILRAGGGPIWVRIGATAAPDADGALVCRATMEDITEAKRAAEALRESEEWFRSLAECAPVGIYLTDRRGDCMYVNPTWCEAAGLSAAEARGQGWMAGLHPEDRATIGQKWSRSIQSGGVWGFEYRFQNKGGQVTRVHGAAAPVRAADGTVIGHVGVNLDITARRRAEEAARATSAYARSLIEVSLDPLVTISAEGRITDVNEAFVQATGVPRDCLIGAGFSGFFTEPEMARQGYQRAFSEGIVRDYPLAIRHVSGRVTDVLYNASVYRDGQGQVLGVFAAARDVSERKRAHLALERSRAELRAIYESAPVLMCTLGPDRSVLYANRAFTEFTGVPESDLHGGRACGVFGCINASTDPRGCGFGPRCAGCALRRAIEDTLTTGREHREVEYRATLDPNGVRRDVILLGATTRIEAGDLSVLLLCLRDVTEQRRAEDAIRESAARYRSLFENSLLPISLALPDGRLLAVNAAYARMYGYTSQDEMLAAVSHVGPQFYANPADRAEVLRLLAEKGEMEPREFVLVRRDGTRFVAVVGAREIRDADGRLFCYQAVHLDITERKRAEQELLASREQLRALATRIQAAREEERTALARDLHDGLAQELTRLKIDLLLLHGRLGKPGKAMARDVMVPRVAKMAETADATIQSVQRIATGLRPAVLDSLGLCAAVEWQARDFQEHAGIPCRANVPAAELAAGREVATAAFRILQESLTNIQRHARATRVEVSLRQEAGLLVLGIEDNGCGIDPEVLRSPLSIGLAGMRERALLLGGQLQIRSQPGAGTSVAVRLPLSQRAPPPEATA